MRAQAVYRNTLVLAALGILLAAQGVRSARAADPAFVGVLALALDDQAAALLALDEATRAQLQQLVDQRETEAVRLVLELRGAPPEERQRRMAAFVAESERRGRALLTVAQRAKLEQLRIARAGMETLQEPAVARVLNLSEDQQSRVRQLLEARERALREAGEAERAATRRDYERRLADLLTDAQRAAWQKLAGLADGQPLAAAGSVTDEPAAPARAEGAGAPPAPAESDTAAAPSTPPVERAAAAAPAAQPEVRSEAGAPGDSEEPAAAAGEPPAAAAPPAANPPLAQAPRAGGPAGGTEAPTAALDPSQIKLRFNFRFQPWEDVLQWLAEQADLSLQMDAPPEGTFNYTDSRYYTLSEAIDLINSVLLMKGYTLVRRERLLTVINVEENPVPDVLVEFVPLEELDQRGEFELVKCLFQLETMTPEEAEASLQNLIGPQGKIYVFPAAKQILVQETAGKLRIIRRIIEAVENPRTPHAGDVVEIPLQYISPEEVLEVARPLLGLPEDANVGEGISISTDGYGARLFATGTPENLQRLQDLVAKLDRSPAETPSGAGAEAAEQLQLMIHPVTVADPTTVLQVMQTLLAGQEGVRLAIDPATENLVALATPSQHALIQATLREMEREGDKVFDVIPLARVDPQLAVVSINKFFGITEESTEGPTIDADPIARKLFVRGSKEEIAKIREFVAMLEESQPAVGEGTVRLVPFGAADPKTALDMAQLLWTGRNPIRLVTPSTGGGSLIQQREVSPDEPPAGEEPEGPRAPRQRLIPLPQPPASSDRPASPGENPSGRAAPKTTQRRALHGRTAEAGSFGPRVRPAAWRRPQDEPAEDAAPVAAAAPSPSDRPEAGTPQAAAKPPAEIRVSVTPNGILLTSDDEEALDEFQRLLQNVLDSTGGGGGLSALGMGQTITVFYLKYAEAEVAAQLLNDILSGARTIGGGESLVGDVASGLLGAGGGLLGAVLGGESGGALTVGAVSIVPDARLNRLICQGSPADLQKIEMLLKVIDQEASITEVQTKGVPHIIPVYYVSAADVAEMVREAFADRIASGQGGRGGSSGRPSPEEFMRAIAERLRSGGRGGPGGSRTQTANQPPTMTLAVDERNNALIVTAPEPLYEQVRALVEEIDQMAAAHSDDDIRVVTLDGGTNAELVQQALATILGTGGSRSTRSSSSRTSSSSSASQPPTPTSGFRPPFGGASPEEIRRRIEFFRQLRGGGDLGGRPSSSSSGGGSSSSPRPSAAPGGRPSGGFGGRPGGFGGQPGGFGGRPGGSRGGPGRGPGGR